MKMNPSLLKTLTSLSLLLLLSSVPQEQHFLAQTVVVIAGAEDTIMNRVPVGPPSSDPQAFTVFIINTVPTVKDKLRVHCASKDNDLGYRNLEQNQYFKWSFKENIWVVDGTTLFFCHFWWGINREKAFDVFRPDIGSQWCRKLRSCYWVVQEDGFYITDDYSYGSLLHKRFVW